VAGEKSGSKMNISWKVDWLATIHILNNIPRGSLYGRSPLINIPDVVGIK